MQVANAEHELTEWKKKVDDLRKSYHWLLLLSVNKVNSVHRLIKSEDATGLCREIEHLFTNRSHVRDSLLKAIEVRILQRH